MTIPTVAMSGVPGGTAIRPGTRRDLPTQRTVKPISLASALPASLQALIARDHAGLQARCRVPAST